MAMTELNTEGPDLRQPGSGIWGRMGALRKVKTSTVQEGLGTSRKAKAEADPKQTAITQFFKKQKQ
jgi:hypothetical protein